MSGHRPCRGLGDPRSARDPRLRQDLDRARKACGHLRRPGTVCDELDVVGYVDTVRMFVKHLCPASRRIPLNYWMWSLSPSLRSTADGLGSHPHAPYLGIYLCVRRFFVALPGEPVARTRRIVLGVHARTSTKAHPPRKPVNKRELQVYLPKTHKTFKFQTEPKRGTHEGHSILGQELAGAWVFHYTLSLHSTWNM